MNVKHDPWIIRILLVLVILIGLAAAIDRQTK